MMSRTTRKTLSMLHAEERSFLVDLYRIGLDDAMTDAGEGGPEALSALEVYGLSDAEGVLTPAGTRLARELAGE